jgi:hypothetical protein
MKLISSLIDKIFFTFGVIIFLQLPHFIDQYNQRIGGYAESKSQQLNDYQKIAKNNFAGDIQALINSFKNSNDDAVKETGKNIEQTLIDVKVLQHEIEVLATDGLFNKLIFLSTNLRYDLAKGTLGSFQPGIPLNLWALIYGLVGGILFSLIFNGFLFIPKRMIEKRRIRKSKTFAS